jgi:hypothetical protein
MSGITSEQGRERVRKRWRNDRQGLPAHVEAVVTRSDALTDAERIRIATALVARTRTDQGLPEQVEDPVVREQVATVLSREVSEQTRAVT